ncbi:MAG: alkaline phosphatase D family protein, partial [Candidatus Binatia bacterium]
PRAGIGARKNYWYALSAAGFDFFVADTRTGRRRDRAAASLTATVGDDLMIALRLWLIEAHKRGLDKPKFIVSPSVVAPWTKETRGHPAYALRSDAWDAFPDSLHQLLGFIATEGIRNVVFLSGDYHCSIFSCLSLKCGGAAPVTAYSIVSSGLYSPYPFANTRVEDLELCFQGTHRDWLGGGDAPCCNRLGELEISYVAKPMAACASFAVVGVERRGSESWMTVGFDEGTAPVEVRLS